METTRSENPAPRKVSAPARKRQGSWLVTAGLILLSIFPLIFGSLRMIELARGAEITPDNARFFASPLPVVIHFASAAVYALLGAVQFPTGLRRRALGWHRIAGRFLVVCGLLVGGSGLWMTLFYSRPPGTGDLLYAIRLFFGSGMVLSMVLGYQAGRRRDINTHKAWMMRGYAIGLGAASQMLVIMVWEIAAGQPGETTHALLMGLGWVINLAVAELALRRRRSPRIRPAVA